jgi:hypothetical protein
MTPRDFCYWLQGLLELDDLDSLNKEQLEKIKNKLDSCFVHEAAQVTVVKPLKPGTDNSGSHNHNIVYRC